MRPLLWIARPLFLLKRGKIENFSELHLGSTCLLKREEARAAFSLNCCSSPVVSPTEEAAARASLLCLFSRSLIRVLKQRRPASYFLQLAQLAKWGVSQGAFCGFNKQLVDESLAPSVGFLLRVILAWWGERLESALLKGGRGRGVPLCLRSIGGRERRVLSSARKNVNGGSVSARRRSMVRKEARRVEDMAGHRRGTGSVQTLQHGSRGRRPGGAEMGCSREATHLQQTPHCNSGVDRFQAQHGGPDCACGCQKVRTRRTPEPRWEGSCYQRAGQWASP